VEYYEQQFKAAAGEGAIVELKMRLLADKTPALQKAAYNKELGNIETLIAAHFANVLTDDEKTTFVLPASYGIKFSTATSGPPVRGSNV
jgi:hypothetical protein